MLPDTGIDDVKKQRNAEYAKHIYDPVLSSLKMEGIRLLFLTSMKTIKRRGMDINNRFISIFIQSVDSLLNDRHAVYVTRRIIGPSCPQHWHLTHHCPSYEIQCHVLGTWLLQSHVHTKADATNSNADVRVALILNENGLCNAVQLPPFILTWRGRGVATKLWEYMTGGIGHTLLVL
jgi:hypothetical protein